MKKMESTTAKLLAKRSEPDKVAEGLPSIAPDFVEQDAPEILDNIVPTHGYEMMPMVGLGGSAGSIQALQNFFKAMPPDSGMSFVVILHLSPEHNSTLAEMIGLWTSMRSVQAEDGQKVEPNCIYVIPPGKYLSATDGHLKLTDLEEERGKRVAVDLFFRTLADSHGPHSAAIILSGADGDGALGIKRIKERGGLTIAQDPDEAEHSSMPRSAIETGMVDWVLQVAQMPQRLVEYQEAERRLQLPPEEGPQPAKTEKVPPDESEKALREVLNFVRTRTGRDFSYYKRATILRRVARRLQVNALESLPAYLDFMRTHPGEAGALLQDLLISVTNFFRDRDAFDALEARIPELFQGKGSGDTVRVWVAACATGDEAYSIAMLLTEHARTLDSPPAIQVFATDLEEEVITKAREASYPLTIQADVSEERLRRFFIKEPHGFRVRRELREIVLFALHDLLKDAPFSRLDLISCRNLLIYLNREAQTRVFDIFHFAMRPAGRLFLGSSETVDDGSPLFTVLDKKHRIYAHKASMKSKLPVPIGPGTLAKALELQERTRSGPFLPGKLFHPSAALSGMAGGGAELEHEPRASWEELHYKLIERFAPPSVIVNREYEIAHISENAGRFLHFSGGEPTMNLLHVVHPMLRIELRAALFRAAQTERAAEAFNVPVEINGERLSVDLRVAPAQEIAPDFLLVVLQTRENGSAAAMAPPADAEPAARHLEREIEQVKRRLRDSVEQYEASTEELKASNEELQAMNEELRSATEELETSREELQSINEELTTVNQELKSKVDELGNANSDMNNLMASTDIATVFLDRDLHIMRYTPPAVELFRLIPSDIGRPLNDLHHRLNYPELKTDAERVIERLVPVEREVSNADGMWFLARLLAYRTADNHINGVVLNFVDVTENKRDRKALAESVRRIEEQKRIYDAMLSGIADFAYIFDRQGRFLYANRTLLDLLGMSLQEIVGKNFHELPYPSELAAKLHAQIETVINTGETKVDETPFVNPKGRQGVYEYIFRPVLSADGKTVEFVAGSTRDVTERQQVEEELRASEEKLRLIMENAREYAIFSTDFTMNVTSWNSGAERLLGFSEEEIVGQKADIIFTPEDRAAGAPETERAQALAEGRASDERWHMRKNGSRFWGSGFLMAMHSEHQQIVGFVKILRDLTEARQAELTIRASQERFRALIRNVKDYSIFTLDSKGLITDWNAGAERLKGYTAEEVIGREMTIFYPPEARAAGMPQRELKAAEMKGSAESEGWLVRKDGTRFFAHEVVTAFHDETGTLVGFTKVCRDLTERRKSEEAINTAQGELENRVLERTGALRKANRELSLEITERNRLEKEILEVSEREQRRLGQDLHDGLCQELTAIAFMARAQSQRLREKNPDESRDINKIAEHLNAMVVAARDVARGLHPVEMDADGLRSALVTLIRRLERPDVLCELDCDRPIPVHDSAAALNLYRIAQEALTNALKHSGATKISVSLKRQTDHIELSVCDNGRGFSRRKGRQQGLGLHIMKYRAQTIGASISITNLTPNGTCVTCSFPTNT